MHFICLYIYRQVSAFMMMSHLLPAMSNHLPGKKCVLNAVFFPLKV